MKVIKGCVKSYPFAFEVPGCVLSWLWEIKINLTLKCMDVYYHIFKTCSRQAEPYTIAMRDHVKPK